MHWEIDFHDAELISVHLSPPNRSLTVVVSAYLKEGWGDRFNVTISFPDIIQFNMMADMVAMQKGRGPGNVNYYNVPAKAKHHYIHLVDGCLHVQAKGSPTFQVEGGEKVDFRNLSPLDPTSA